MAKRNQNHPRFHEVFSPTIMETNVPQKFIDIVNDVGDEVLNDEKKSVQYDWSHKLVGKVSKEVRDTSSHSRGQRFTFQGDA